MCTNGPARCREGRRSIEGGAAARRETMEIWQRHHKGGLTAFVTRFAGERFRASTVDAEGHRPRHRDVVRTTVRGAQRRGDELIRAYYRHSCVPLHCGRWQRILPLDERRTPEIRPPRV
jgi:hypothetical protein